MGGRKAPGKEGMPWGDEINRVTPEGYGVPDGDGPGKGGDGKPPSNQATAHAKSERVENMGISGTGPATQLCNQRDGTMGHIGGGDNKE